MPSVLFETEHVRVEEDTSAKVVTLIRKQTSPSTAELLSHFERVMEAIRPEHHEYGLVIDSRQVRGRNDEGFEHALAKYRQASRLHFARTVVLVATAVGELQARRLDREEGGGMIITRDPQRAFAIASGVNDRTIGG